MPTLEEDAAAGCFTTDKGITRYRYGKNEDAKFFASNVSFNEVLYVPPAEEIRAMALLDAAADGREFVRINGVGVRFASLFRSLQYFVYELGDEYS